MAQPPAHAQRTAYILLTLMALCFGGTWVAGKVAVEAVPPMTVAAVRFAVASVLLWLWTRAKAPSRRLMPGDLLLILGMGLTAVAGYNFLFLTGLRLAPASDGAIIVPGVAPMLTAVLAWPLLGERIGRWGAVGLGLALGGLMLVMAPAGGAGTNRFAGDILFFLGAVCWAIYSIIGKNATARFNPVRATLYGTITGTLLLLPFAAAERAWTVLARAPAAAWFGILYLGIFGTVLAFVFFYEGIQRIGAARATSFALLVPIFGVASSVAMLGEELAPPTVAGAALVLMGLWLVQRRPGRSEGAAVAAPARSR